MFGTKQPENKSKLPTNIGKMEVHIELKNGKKYSIVFTGTEHGRIHCRASIDLFLSQRVRNGFLMLEEGRLVPISEVVDMAYGKVIDLVTDV